MSNTHQTSSEYFKALSIIHGALLGGQVMFLLLSVFLNSGDQPFGEKGELDQIFQYLAPLLCVAAIISSHLLYKKRIADIQQQNDLIDKLTDYRGAFIIKLALLESATLFAVICYLLTANFLYVPLFIAMAVLFFFNRTTKTRIIRELNLSAEEVKSFDNPDAIVARISQN